MQSVFRALLSAVVSAGGCAKQLGFAKQRCRVAGVCHRVEIKARAVTAALCCDCSAPRFRYCASPCVVAVFGCGL